MLRYSIKVDLLIKPRTGSKNQLLSQMQRDMAKARCT